MTDDDIEEASTLILNLLARLNCEWPTWKRRDGHEPSPFITHLMPGNSNGVRICVQLWGKREPLGFWRYKGDKYIFSASDEEPGPHFYAALTENEAVRWTRSVCCAPRADLMPTRLGTPRTSRSRGRTKHPHEGR